MYQDLRRLFWWTSMKREIAKYVAECDTCRRVKAEHQRPAGTLRPIAIPEWKWDEIGMDPPMATVGCTIHHLRTSAHPLKSHEQNRSHDGCSCSTCSCNQQMNGHASRLHVVQEHVQQSSSSITAGQPCLPSTTELKHIQEDNSM